MTEEQKKELKQVRADLEKANKEFEALLDDPASYNKNSLSKLETKEEHRERHWQAYRDYIEKYLDIADQEMPAEMRRYRMEHPETDIDHHCEHFPEFLPNEIATFDEWAKASRETRWRDPEGLTDQASVKMKIILRWIKKLEQRKDALL